MVALAILGRTYPWSSRPVHSNAYALSVIQIFQDGFIGQGNYESNLLKVLLQLPLVSLSRVKSIGLTDCARIKLVFYRKINQQVWSIKPVPLPYFRDTFSMK